MEIDQGLRVVEWLLGFRGWRLIAGGSSRRGQHRRGNKCVEQQGERGGRGKGGCKLEVGRVTGVWKRDRWRERER